tara:strand:- start:380 stop:577 length:198 start_codon:yes stop_codon:yes gene_type:complete
MNILTDQELAERLTKKEANLEWWETKLAKPSQYSFGALCNAPQRDCRAKEYSVCKALCRASLKRQ